MKNVVEQKIRFLDLAYVDITDEQIYRRIASKMVNEMHIDELHKLMNLKKINPLSDESFD